MDNNVATLLAIEPNEQVFYAVATSKDGENVFFFAKNNKNFELNRWLQDIYTKAKNSEAYKIDQTKFEKQFEQFNLMGGVTEYVHKKNKKVKFRIKKGD